MTTGIAELVRYREVLVNFIAKDLKIKYRGTLLGYAWSLLNPLLQLAVLSLIFSHITRLEMKHYTLYLFSGLLAWNFFQSGLITASYSFLEHEDFIKKIYLPKLLFPLSKICMRFVDLALAIVALGILGLVLGLPIHWTALALPLAILPLFAFTLGVSAVGAVLNVYFRDMQYLLQVFLQLLYFLTPILYPLSLLPSTYQRWLNLNPVTHIILPFQRLLYDGRFPNGPEWGLTYGVGIGALTIGLLFLSLKEDELVFWI